MLVVDGGAISLTRVRAVFDTPMLNDARLVDPLNYELIAKLIPSGGYWLLPSPGVPPFQTASPAPVSPHGIVHVYEDGGPIANSIWIQETSLPLGSPAKGWIDINGVRYQYHTFHNPSPPPPPGMFIISMAFGQSVPAFSNGDEVVVHSEGDVEFMAYIGNQPYGDTIIDIQQYADKYGWPSPAPTTGNLTIYRTDGYVWQETYYNVTHINAGGEQTHGTFILNGGDFLVKDTLPWYDSGSAFFHQTRTPEYGESPIYIPTNPNKAAELFHSEIIPERAVYPRWVDIILDTEMTDGGEYELRILPPELGGPASPDGDGFEIDYAADFKGIGEKPEVQAVQAVGLNRVDVIFTERMKNNDAIKDPNNYVFDKGLVVKSVLGVDEETVMLATSDQEPGELYTLTVAPTP